MATKTLKTKFQLRYDTLANWTSKNPTLLAGEIAVVSVPTTSSTTVEQVTKPAILFKVGDGTTPFNTLPYASGKAADVYAWAKAAEKPTYTKAEIGLGNVENVASYSKAEIDNMLGDIEGALEVDTNTEYQLVNDGTKIKLQSRAKGASSWTDEEEYDLATVLANTFDAKGAASEAVLQAVEEANGHTDDEITKLTNGTTAFHTVKMGGSIQWPAGNGTGKIEIDDNNDYINVSKGIEINGTKLEDIYAAKGHTHAEYETALEDLGDSIYQHTQDINNIGNLAQGTANKVDAFLDAAGIKDTTLDTLSEIQKFITDEAAAADQLVNRVGALEQTDTEINRELEDLNGKVANHTTAISELQQGFAQSNHSHTNKTVLDGITATKVSNWDNEVGAKDLANGLKSGSVGFTKISFPAEGGANIQMNADNYHLDIIASDGVNINSIYEDGVALSNKYLGKTAQAADAAKLNGQAASYYATAQSVTDVASDLIGVSNRVKAIEEVDTLILQGGGAGDNYA